MCVTPNQITLYDVDSIAEINDKGKMNKTLNSYLTSTDYAAKT